MRRICYSSFKSEVFHFWNVETLWWFLEGTETNYGMLPYEVYVVIEKPIVFFTKKLRLPGQKSTLVKESMISLLNERKKEIFKVKVEQT